MSNESSRPDGGNGNDRQSRGGGQWEIVRAGVEELDRVEPLWLALAEHTAMVATETAPRLPGHESWRRAREHHARHLAKPGSFMLLAEREGELIGYALIVVDSLPSLTWKLDDRRASIMELSVLPADRGHGVGGALIGATKSALTEAEVHRVSLDVLVDNRARSLYERHGFTTEAVHMSARFSSGPV